MAGRLFVGHRDKVVRPLRLAFETGRAPTLQCRATLAMLEMFECASPGVAILPPGPQWGAGLAFPS